VSLVGLPAAVVRPVFEPAVALAVGTNRECGADLSGVALTRYPPGLISALEKLRADSAASHLNSRATAHLWIAWPHPPLDERIKVLKEL